MDAGSLPDFKVIPYTADDADADDEKTLTSLFDDPISLKTSSSWTYCGPLLSLCPDLLPSSFHDWVASTVNGSLQVPFVSFLGFVHEFLEENNISNYWITIRATQGSHEFDIPRWHTDDLFFAPIPAQARRSSLSSFPTAMKLARRTSTSHQRAQSRDFSYGPAETKQVPTSSYAQVTTANPNPANWKLCTTLLGPGTLFIGPKTSPRARQIQRELKRTVRDESPDHLCPVVRCVGCAMAAESIRTQLADELGQYDIVQSQRGECAFFKVGEDEGAVHSEPMCHGDRIFVNVVPGHETDLKNLLAKWGMEYPRTWCVGLPTHHEYCSSDCAGELGGGNVDPFDYSRKSFLLDEKTE